MARVFWPSLLAASPSFASLSAEHGHAFIEALPGLPFSDSPDLVLFGETPRLIDEWQRVPEIWDYVRRAVDDRQAKGQFILTGSMIPGDEQVRHSGAGRIDRMTMRPMSLYETGHSTGEVSLSALFLGESLPGTRSELTVPDIADPIFCGRLALEPQAARSSSDQGKP